MRNFEEPKWQRVKYMPATSLFRDRERVTGSKEHIALSRKAATEGMVLLKNDNDILPFEKGSKLALFGKGIADYVKGGGGSGDTTVAYVRTILQGLKIKEEEGKISLFTPLCDFFEKSVAAQYQNGAEPGRTTEVMPPQDLFERSAQFTDTAVVVISRFSGEGYDRTGKAYDGDFYLSREEEALVKKVEEYFARIVVILNTGGMMDTLWFKNNSKVEASLLAWQGGMEGGLATADILVGDAYPSGHLSDTFATDFDAYPSSANFNESEDYVEYTEDIYVGYRYFETMEGAANKVAYPFGYGLTYSSFGLSDVKGEILSSNEVSPSLIMISAIIKNEGKRPGREVVQVYAEAPCKKLGKSKRVLVGFAKTEELQPGEEKKVEIEVNPYYFASFDDSGKILKSSYVLEKGIYRFHVGFNVRETARADFDYILDEDVVLETLSSKCAPKQLHKRMLMDGSYEELPVDDTFEIEKTDLAKLPFDGQVPLENDFVYPGCFWAEHNLPCLMDVYEGKTPLSDFMNLLNDEMKINILGGQPNRGIANTFGMGNNDQYGIPNVMTADGPQGLRIRPECGIYTTAFPCANLMACSWDPDLAFEVNKAAASEVIENGIGIFLTPAINIHRTPLCGRNFEYYSEDPFLTGVMATAVVKGIQSQGVAASLKHFALNNKETNRRDSDSRVSERAMREIYLKGFEMCVKEAKPWTVMSSYNIVNGVRASENRELLTGILREEWGFDGLVTSDWCNHGTHYKEINAGNDVKMCTGMPQDCMEALEDGRLNRDALNESVKRVLELILKIR